MFRPLRRTKQQISEAEVQRVMNENSTGTLAVIGDEGYPYQVPLNFVYLNGTIYMHGAKEGHKIDAVRNSDKATFCVIDADEILSEAYTDLYRSVIAFGRPRIVESEEEANEAMMAFCLKFNPSVEGAKETLAGSMPSTAVIAMDVEHITGKQSMRLFGE